MTMINLILCIAYSIGFIITSKLYVKAYTYSYKNLAWDGSDTFICLIMAFLWPIFIVPIFIICLNKSMDSKGKSLLPFKRWHKEYSDKLK